MPVSPPTTGLTTLITYGEDNAQEIWECASGHVMRCISSIAADNTVDAEWALQVLNRFGHMIPHPADNILPAEQPRPRIDFAAEDAYDQALASPELRQAFNATVVDAVNRHLGTTFTIDDILTHEWRRERPAIELGSHEVTIHSPAGARTTLSASSMREGFLHYGFEDFVQHYLETKGEHMTAEMMMDIRPSWNFVPQTRRRP